LRRMTMRRRAIAVVTTAIALFCISADLGACGDKFLRIGRSARLKNYNSIHPASILLYRKATSKDKDVKDFEAQLKKAGHKAVVVPHGSAIATLVSTGKFDLIIADRKDMEALKAELRSVTAPPGFVPLVDKPSKEYLAQVTKEYHCVLVQNGDM